MEVQSSSHLSLTLLLRALDCSLNGVFVYETIRNEAGHPVDFRILVANRMAAHQIGYRPDALVGRTMREVFAGDPLPDLINRFRNVVDSGKTDRFELEYPLRQRNLIGWFELSVAPLDDGLDGLIVTYNDITAAKKVTHLLTEQTSLLETIFQTSMNGLVAYLAVRDQSGDITDFQAYSCNQALADMTRQSREEVLMRTLRERFPEGSRLLPHYTEIVRTGQSKRFEEYFPSVDTWYHLSINKLGDGVLVSIMDNSDKKRTYHQLQGVLDGSIACITTLRAVRDPQGMIADLVYTSVNRAAELLEGLSAKDMVGRSVIELSPGVLSTGLFKRYVQTIETGQSQRFEQFYDADGFTGWLHFSIVKNNDGIVLTYLDITEMKEVQQELENKIRDLKRSNEELEQFAFVASHDLQEPLRKIQSFGGMLRRQHSHGLSRAGVDLVQRMQQAANRMQGLIQDLLIYSRVSVQQEPFQPVSLEAVCREVISDLDTLIQEKKGSVRVGQLPTIPGNPLQLSQLFQNLFSNALKFCRAEEPPRIVVRSRSVCFTDIPEELRTDQRQPDERQAWWELQIIDNGIGFEEKYLDRIFQVFQRLHTRTTYEGTGIGLAICKKVVDSHNGFLTARSSPNEGSTFFLYFPA